MTPPLKKDGFRGQHMVVVPPPLRSVATNHPLLKGLLVTDAGYFPNAEGHRVERPQGAPTHLIIVCIQGSGWVRSGSRQTIINAGTFVWLPANVPHAYGSSDGQSWTIVWAHFAGAEARSWFTELGWDPNSPIGTFKFGQHASATLGLEKTYAYLELGYSTHHLLSASSALRSVLATVLELTKGVGLAKTAEERTAGVREEIVLEPARLYKLSELADRAGLSIPHFSLLFKRQTGYAPIDFVLRQRIRLSCRLLDNTAKSIGTIASEVGFEDPYYFSRCFHRVMGSSPRAYRQTVKG